MDVSFGTIWEAVARSLPGEVAISEPGRDYTYAEFDDRSARLATALTAAGVGPGDKVACYQYNAAPYLETVFAAFKLGAVPVNANYRYTQNELFALLRDADAAALLFSEQLAANVAGAADHVPTLKLAAGVGAGYEKLLQDNEPRPQRDRPGSDELFMYTGGTTGKPKGVIWRLGDLLHSIFVAIYRPLGVTTPPADLAEAVGIAVRARTEGRSPVMMPAVPLMHGTGFFNSMGALLVGGRIVTMRQGGLDPRHAWETVAAQRVGTVIVAGDAVARPLVDELVTAGREGRPHDLGSLRSMLSSGTAFSDPVKRALHERAQVTIIDAIASTEGGPFAFAVTSTVDDLPARFFPVPATKVVTDDGAEVTPGSGQTGMLAYSGPIPLGYYKDSAKTSATFRVIDGVRYAIPGDVAEVAEDGSLRFLGRGSGVINTGGEKVHPPEVEQVLLAHPNVTDCVVLGIHDEKWGERVAAVVATRGGVTDQDLRDWARRSLAGYKVPRTVVLLPKLHRTPTGKLELAWAKQILKAASAHDR